MCRIVGFIGVGNNINKSDIIVNIAKNLSHQKFKVCVIDVNFGYNETIYEFQKSKSTDIKDYLLGKRGIVDSLNEINQNLFFVKCDNVFFDYEKYLKDFTVLIKYIANRFDFIFVDLNYFNTKVYDYFLNIINECFIVMSGENSSIKLSRKIIQKQSLYENIKNQKIILDNYKVVSKINHKILSETDIEDVLKVKVLSVIPKIKFNYKYITKIYNELSYDFITNNGNAIYVEKPYSGAIGLLRRKLYEKFENWKNKKWLSVIFNWKWIRYTGIFLQKFKKWYSQCFEKIFLFWWKKFNTKSEGFERQ